MHTLVCLRKKTITFMNEHKRQKKNIIADKEYCVIDVTTNSNKYVIAEHIPKSVGYIWQSSFNYYLGLECIKKDWLAIYLN